MTLEIIELKEKLDNHRDRIEGLNHAKETLQSEKEALERERSEHISLSKLSPSEPSRASHIGLDSEFLHDATSQENKELKRKVQLLENENRRLKEKPGNDNELQEAIRAEGIKAKEEKVKQLQEQLKKQLEDISKLKDLHRDEKKKLENACVAKEEEIKLLKEKNEKNESLLQQTLENSQKGQDKRTHDENLQKDIKSEERIQQIIQAYSKENEELHRKIKRIEDQRNQEQRLVMSAFYDIGLEYQSFLLNRNLDGGSNHSRRSQQSKSWLNKERNKTYAQ